MRRWQCPKCGRGANAPERLGRMDSRRYYLTCSAKGTQLIERVCPAREREKLKTKERRAAKTARKQTRRAERIAKAKAADVAAPYRDSNSKIRAEFRRLCRLKCWGRVLSPSFVIRRSQVVDERTSGHCWGDRRIVITIGYESDAAEINETILHELAHAASRCRDRHNDAFRSLFVESAREAYGIESVSPRSRHIGHLSRAVAESIRETLTLEIVLKGENPK